MKKKITALALGAQLIVGLATSQAYAAVAKEDAKFFEKAAVGGMYEVEAGKIASIKASDPDVKAFGEKMVTDHTAAGEKLKALAVKKGVSLPAALDADHTKKLEKLNAAKAGEDFDDEYIDQMEDGHDKTISLYESASKDAKDPEVRSFAAAAVTTPKHHREILNKLDDKH